MKITKRELSHYWTFVPLAIWLGIVVSPSYFSFWTDSEMWTVAATKYLFSGQPEYYFGTKPLFHFLLYLNTRLATWLHVHPMETARAFMTLNTLGLLLAFSLILRREGGSRLALFGFAFLVSLSFFIKRIGQVRSDIVIAHILLWCLYCIPLLTNRRRKIVWGLAFVTSLLITPKALVWCLAFLPFLPLNTLRRQKMTWIFCAGVLILGLTLLFLFPFFHQLIFDPLDFFYRSFFAAEVGVPYFSWDRLLYVIRFAQENPHFILAFFIFGIWGLKNKASYSPYTWRIQIMGWILFLIFALYPDRLPFMIAALLPFWVTQIMLSTPIRRFFSYSDNSTRSMGLIFAALAYLLSLHWALLVFGSHSSHNQRKISYWLQSELDRQPSVEVYDPVGILPFQQAHYWFLGPGQTEKNRHVNHYIEYLKPEVVFYVPKLAFAEPEVGQLLRAHYKHDGTGIFVRRLLLEDPRKISRPDLLVKMTDTFPRLAKKLDIQWQIEMEVQGGTKLHQVAPWAAFEGEGLLMLPPGVNKISIQPFRLSLPFNSNLFSEFVFDKDF